MFSTLRKNIIKSNNVLFRRLSYNKNFFQNYDLKLNRILGVIFVGGCVGLYTHYDKQNNLSREFLREYVKIVSEFKKVE